MARRVDIVGGGPGGLYLAILLRRLSPSTEVRLHEREAPEETFGFGIGFSGRTLAQLTEASADIRDRLGSLARSVPGAEFRLPSGTVFIPAKGNATVERAGLLRLLSEEARAAGVDLRLGARVDQAGLDADLVVAADGAASSARRALAEELGSREELGRGYFIWCGCEQPLDRGVYESAENEGGVFVAHAYPHRADRSTVLIECDPATWHRAGMAANDAAAVADRSDEASLTTMAELFSDLLGGRPLLGNRTRWRRFTTVTCSRWHSGRTILLGDAAHTAHFTIGSGTKLAMEDAIALARALAGEGDVAAAARSYEAERRPAVERLQDLARHSQRWWDSFPTRRADRPSRVAVSFLTRAASISLDRIKEAEGYLLEDAMRSLGAGSSLAGEGDELAASVLSSPVRIAGRNLDSRVVGERAVGIETASIRLPAVFEDPWDEAADQLLGDAARVSADGARLLWVEAADGGSASMAALEFCERLRRELGAAVMARFDAGDSQGAASAVIAGRVDLVSIGGTAPGPTRQPAEARA